MTGPEIAAYLRAVRIEEGITLQSVADAIGVSLSAVSNWETQGHIPLGDNLLRWAYSLGCTVTVWRDDKKESS